MSGYHETNQSYESRYADIEKELKKVADRIRLLNSVVSTSSILMECRDILSGVENTARIVENFRISSLARAVQLMMKRITIEDLGAIQPSTYAYLIYSIQTLIRLAKISSYTFRTGLEAEDNTYVEAIGAIIDHTDELGLPHMKNSKQIKKQIEIR